MFFRELFETMWENYQDFRWIYRKKQTKYKNKQKKPLQD